MLKHENAQFTNIYMIIIAEKSHAILKSMIFNARMLLHKNSPLRCSSASVIFMALKALYDFNKTSVLSRMLH